MADRGNKTVTAAGQCLYETGIFGRVAESFSNLVDRSTKGVIEVNDRVLPPEPQLQLFSGDDLARVFEQDRKNFKRLALDLDPLASLPELAALQVGLEESESCSGRALH
jgi:hypothetical protein